MAQLDDSLANIDKAAHRRLRYSEYGDELANCNKREVIKLHKQLRFIDLQERAGLYVLKKLRQEAEELQQSVRDLSNISDDLRKYDKWKSKQRMRYGKREDKMTSVTTRQSTSVDRSVKKDKDRPKGGVPSMMLRLEKQPLSMKQLKMRRMFSVKHERSMFKDKEDTQIDDN